MISILTGSSMLILTVTAGVMDEKGVMEDDTEMQVVGILILGSILLAVIGSVLGVVNCFQKDKKESLGNHRVSFECAYGSRWYHFDDDLMCLVEGNGERSKGMPVGVIFRTTALPEVASRLC